MDFCSTECTTVYIETYEHKKHMKYSSLPEHKFQCAACEINDINFFADRISFGDGHTS